MNLAESLVLGIILSLSTALCAEFDRSVTGVVYSAYVKRSENGEIPNWKTYSLQDIKTMLEVVATKFSNVATYGVGADNVAYKRNETYQTSNAQVYSGEAAALINRERNEKTIKIFLGMYQSDVRQQMETEVKVALESAEVANSIYPGTVEGLIFTKEDIATSHKRALQTLTLLRKYRGEARRMGLKLGSRQSCNNDLLEEDDDDEEKQKLLTYRRNIVNESDFIICQIEPAIHSLGSDAKTRFETVKNDLLYMRNELTGRNNPNLHVMGETLWPNDGSKTRKNIDNLKSYWELVNKWAVENNFTMWLSEAFDNPWKSSFKAENLGWWRLKQNSLINRKDGYDEKIFDTPEMPETVKVKEEKVAGLGVWAFVGIGAGALVILFVFTLITLLFLRVNKLQATLTKEDIREFMYGVSDDVAAQQGGDVAVESALKFPYDKSYEIPKDKLKIRRDSLLGTGQFGCVYKALIEDENKSEVALKMAKSDCPSSALKSLLSEIKILIYLGKHPNIVSILGAYTAEIVNGVVYVATELCSLGSLENYLRKTQTQTTSVTNTSRYANAPMLHTDETEMNEHNEITPSDMIRWSWEISCGMEYLASKHVIHADLATRNVLLSVDKTAKITDFGLSRRLYDYTNYVKQQQEPLPWRWMAIESLKRLEFSTKSDVWSYGVTLWEIYSLGDLPYPGLSWNLDFVDSLMNGLRMKCPPHASPEIYQIMVDCWNTDPSSRPTFTDLKQSTLNIIESSSKKVIYQA